MWRIRSRVMKFDRRRVCFGASYLPFRDDFVGADKEQYELGP